MLSSCIETALFCKFCLWRNARARSAQRASTLGATRSVMLLRAFLLLVPVQRAGWLAQRAAGVGVVLFCFWFWCNAQCASSRVDFC
ncbi:hypothetical protein A2U01_0074532 [Trifolium medium]|uniref:Uncharacterized protein n=1 Tax=Trifolium medium TaxID=97028 RepID=A0A392SZF6_9FABA|nr:hypothetical protein [Trifolium medium]